ncbi:hypothetical protein EVAR_47519_1 [Eumeta japonica]|uniref:Uncharacterized protein n=1 Tax=Eumeta variegata TaxID=151549 RepID=A0A4C1XUY2_EUMVA|nr:hypothetical protein EVAR_47519_1 [Eumeta japonica]
MIIGRVMLMRPAAGREVILPSIPPRAVAPPVPRAGWRLLHYDRPPRLARPVISRCCLGAGAAPAADSYAVRCLTGLLEFNRALFVAFVLASEIISDIGIDNGTKSEVENRDRGQNRECRIKIKKFTGTRIENENQFGIYNKGFHTKDK